MSDEQDGDGDATYHSDQRPEENIFNFDNIEDLGTLLDSEGADADGGFGFTKDGYSCRNVWVRLVA